MVYMLLKKLFLMFILSTTFCFYSNFCITLSRDPFSRVQTKKISTQIRKQVNDTVNFVGVISTGDSFGAIVQNGNLQEVVYINDKVWGFKVKNITFDSVSLEKDGKIFRHSFS